MGDNKNNKKVRFLLLLFQLILWFDVIVMDIVVIAIKELDLSEQIMIILPINITTITSIIINGLQYKKK